LQSANCPTPCNNYCYTRASTELMLKTTPNSSRKGAPTIQPCSKLTGFSCIRRIEPGNPIKR
jgi:hypothetical protein